MNKKEYDIIKKYKKGIKIKELTQECGISSTHLYFIINKYNISLRRKNTLMTKGKRKDHPLHGTWLVMRDRCNNKNNKVYAYYGGRGIKVCKRWDDFWLFVEDVGEKPSKEYSLDRIDNNGNYEKNNIRWATKKEQANNKRKPRVKGHRYVNYDKNLSKWQLDIKKVLFKRFKTEQEAVCYKILAEHTEGCYGT